MVLGAGFAGLLAAAALAPVLDDVVVLERDRLPSQPVARRGIPQSSQLHNLLHPAHNYTETLVPGFVDALVDAGATRASVAADTYVYELGRRMPQRDVGLELMSAQRPTIDHIIRRLVATHQNVTILEQVSVAGLDISDRCVTAAVGRKPDGSLHRYDATLVVDALGAGSPGLRMLDQAGVGVLVEEREVAQWYCTCEFDVPSRLQGHSRPVLIFPSPPSTRGGMASQAGSCLSVSLSGTSQDVPPGTLPAFLAYAASLEDDELSRLVGRCRPRSEPTVFRRAKATWRHYEQIDWPVAGFVPLGDAFATLNPLQGQGISVAAMQAAALADVVRAADDTRTERTLKFLSAAARPIRLAWDLAAIVGPDDTERLPWSYLAALGRRFDKDADLHRLYVRVWHLLEPVDALAAPEVRSRVAEPER